MAKAGGRGWWPRLVSEKWSQCEGREIREMGSRMGDTPTAAHVGSATPGAGCARMARGRGSMPSPSPLHRRLRELGDCPTAKHK